MDSSDFLKVIVALAAAEVSNFYLIKTFPDRTEEQIEIDSRNRNIILSIRTAILLYSTKRKWPITMCVCITVFITISVIFLRTTIGNESNTDNETSNDSKCQ